MNSLCTSTYYSLMLHWVLVRSGEEKREMAKVYVFWAFGVQDEWWYVA